MPYATIMELPKGVRNHLPEEAQEIWLHTFNAVYEDTGGDRDQGQDRRLGECEAGVCQERRRDVGEKMK